MPYLHCSESAMDLKGHTHKILKQFVRIIKHIKNGTWNQIFFNPLCRENSILVHLVQLVYNTNSTAAINPRQILKDRPSFIYCQRQNRESHQVPACESHQLKMTFAIYFACSSAFLSIISSS